MTIENITTFNSFSDKQFLHYGDIDVGGFYILKHLCQKTGICFRPFNMDIATLQKYSEYTKPLMKNDKKRLRNLLESDYGSVAEYMLKNNCKLEQEALDI